MYTRCPQCSAWYRIEPRLLRNDHAYARCSRCDSVFDTLNTLAVRATEPDLGPLQLLNPPPPEEEVPILPAIGRQRLEELDEALVVSRQRRGMAGGELWRRFLPSRDLLCWGGGILALVFLLLFQIFRFEGKTIAQKPYIRPFLESLCMVFPCTLPPFRDPSHLQVLDRTLNLAANQKSGFEFSLVFANQSELPQAFPKLKLVLDELNGKPVAERVFEPIEYLADWQEGALMPVGQPFEIHLALVKPSREVGGFTIEFQ